MQHNQDLLKLFDDLYFYYMKLGDDYRALAFYDIARLIEMQYKNKPITRGEELMMWRGVGRTTVDIIDEFLTSGRCERLEEVKALVDEHQVEEEEEEEEEEYEDDEEEYEDDEEEEEEEYEDDEDDYEDCLEEFWDEHLSKIDKLDNNTPLQWVRSTNLIYELGNLYPKAALKKFGWFDFVKFHQENATSIIRTLPPATLHFMALELEDMEAGTPEDVGAMCTGCSLALEDRYDGGLCKCEEFEDKAYYEALGVKMPEIDEEF